MVVHYPRSVWKNCYAEHQVPGKTYKKKKKKKKKKKNEKATLFLVEKQLAVILTDFTLEIETSFIKQGKVTWGKTQKQLVLCVILLVFIQLKTGMGFLLCLLYSP